MRVSVIVPTLNEEKAIDKVLSEIPRDVAEEIIVVDSSTDATPKIAENLGAKVVFEWRKGYGQALQSGVEKACGDVVVYIDGDHTYDPEDIRGLIAPIRNDECDVVLGNRLNHKMHPGAMSPWNRFGNAVLSLIFSVCFHTRVSDTQCGLRAFRRQVLKGLSCENLGMPFVTEQLSKLIKNGVRIKVVSVTYRPRIGTTKLCSWLDGFKILSVILRERLSR